MQTEWNPKEGDKVSIDEFPEDGWGSWQVASPKAFNIDNFFLGLQVTAPLPLSAVKDLLSNAEKKNSQPDYAFGAAWKKAWVIEKQDLEAVDYIEPSDIDDDVLGFFSLILSYVLSASDKKEAMKDNGPKQLLNLMPRTDFGTMFKLYIQEKSNSWRCKKGAKENAEDVTLYQAVERLASKRDIKLEELNFFWKKTEKKTEVGPGPVENPGPVSSATLPLLIPQPDYVRSVSQHPHPHPLRLRHHHHLQEYPAASISPFRVYPRKEHLTWPIGVPKMPTIKLESLASRPG